MVKNEQDRIVDEWVAERNKNIGEVKIPQLGEYPPDLDNFYGSLMNEWVTTDLIRHYADAIGDRNPLWRSQDYARGTRWGGIIAPPTFTDSIVQPYPLRFDLEHTKRFGAFAFTPTAYRREMCHVIRPGDRFRVVDRYLGLEEVKPTRPKPCRQFIDTVRRTLINQREETVAIIDVQNNALVNFSLDEEHPLMQSGKNRRRRLTDEERDAIYRGYEEERIRGADTLFWEDVVPGEKLKPLVVGPLSVWDCAAYITAISGHAVAFDLEWERIKLNFDFAYLDPEVNAWTCSGICHFCDNKGHAPVFTGGWAVGFYPQIDGLIGRAICNWMGDDGFVNRINTQVPVYPILGEVLRVKGQVTNKSTEGDQHLVDLEVHCENQDGLLLVSGSAVVRLLSRTDFKVF